MLNRERWTVGLLLSVLTAHLASGAGRSFWEDEVYTLQLAAKPATALLNAPEETASPFFCLLLQPWLALGTEEIVARLFPMLFAIAGAWLAFGWLRRFMGAPIAILTLLLLSLSPGFSLWTREVRPYGLFFLLTVATAACWWRYARDGTDRSLLPAILLSTAAFLVHYAAFLQLLALALWPALSRTARSRACGLYLLAGPAATALFSLLLWPDLFRTIADTVRIQVTGLPALLPGGPVGRCAYGLFAFCLGETVYPLNLPVLFLSAASFGLAGAYGLRALRSADRAASAFWTLWASFPLLASAARGISFGPKYLIPSLLPFLLIAARGVLALPRPWGVATLGAIVLSSLYSSVNDALGREHHNMARIEPLQEVAEWIRGRGFEEGDELVLAPDHLPLRWYLRETPGTVISQKFGRTPRRTGRLYYLLCSPGQDPEGKATLSTARRISEELRRELGPPDEEQAWGADPLADNKSRWIQKTFLRYRLTLLLWEQARR